jgi:formyl-CoA transferase
MTRAFRPRRRAGRTAPRVDVDYPTRGTYQTVGCPVKLSDSPVRVSRPPLLGEHTEPLLSELCGVGPEEVKRLHDDGVV